MKTWNINGHTIQRLHKPIEVSGIIDRRYKCMICGNWSYNLDSFTNELPACGVTLREDHHYTKLDVSEYKRAMYEFLTDQPKNILANPQVIYLQLSELLDHHTKTYSTKKQN